MSITSFRFLFFAACTVLAYRIMPAKWRWTVLLAASAVFYLSFSVPGLLILTATALLTYLAAIKIQKVHDEEEKWLAENKKTVGKEERKAKKKSFQKIRKRYVAAIVVVSLGQLFLFKYYGPFASGVNNLFSINLWTAENLLMPLGISFYSLQLIGYIVDVSRGIIRAEKNPLKVILYGAFFLSIMQGPFNRYNQLMPQICGGEKQHLTFYKFKLAALKITWGYIKKMCIADQIGTIASAVFNNYSNYSGAGIILGMVCFAVQLYADFSGYMEIIMGIGELLGIELPENFRQPFFSRNMSEFWQRWHITLGAWLKDYVFYPILKSDLFQNMGKRLSEKLGKESGRTIPTYIGMFILWTLIGAWHGAGFNYVFGVGILQFIYIFSGEIAEPLNEKMRNALRIKKDGRLWHIFQSLRCTVLMIFAWIFFNSQSFGDAIRMIGRVFAGRPGLGQIQAIFSNEEVVESCVTGSYKIWLIYIALCVAALFAADIMHNRGMSIRKKIEQKPYAVRMWIYLALIFTIIVFGAYGEQYSAGSFIYFKF